MAEIAITSENFEKEVKSSEKPILLDFWATWCGPCNMLAPIVEKFAEEHEEKLNVGKVNVDDEEELAMNFGIMSIPTLVLMIGGEAVATSVGLRSKSELEKIFLPYINKGLAH